MAWTAGGNLATARYGLSGVGSNSAAFGSGGTTGSNSNVTEEYNGSTWGAGGNLGTARRYLTGHGTLTAGLTSGGYTTTQVTTCEEYDGTTWSAGGSLSTARFAHAGFGIQTAAVSAGGTGAANYDTSEEYDGAAWAAGGTMAATRAYHAGCGTLASGLVSGGVVTAVTNPPENSSYEYDGTTWSAGGNLTTARVLLGVCGTQTDSLTISGAAYSGGTWTNYASVERYNGSNWSAFDDVSTARRVHSATQSGDTGIMFGGWNGTTYYNSTEMGATIFGVSPLTGTFTMPDALVPTYIAASPLTATFTVPAPTIVSSIKVLPDPLTGTFTIPDVVAGVGVVAVDPLTATFTIPDVTVSLPCIVVVNPLSGAFYILDPYVVAAQKSILFGSKNFPCGKTMFYRIIDDTSTVIQDWTTTGVWETVVDVTADKSTYKVRTNKVNENFQGEIHWKTSDATPLTAVEIINIYSSYVDILQNRLTAQRATNLDNLDSTVSGVLTETQSHPTLSEIEGSSILAKEATVVSAQTDITSVLNYAIAMSKWKNNKLARTVVGATETWVLYDDDSTTPMLTWAHNTSTKVRTKAT